MEPAAGRASGRSESHAAAELGSGVVFSAGL